MARYPESGQRSTLGRSQLERQRVGHGRSALLEAHANPGFSIGSPLVRFANAIGEIALGDGEPFTADAVKTEYIRLKSKIKKRELNLRRVPSLQLLYKPK